MITSTGYKLPQSVISNTGWENEYRLSFQDGTFAYTTQSDNRLVVGNFLLNIPQDNTIYNIEVTVTGYRNSFPTTLKIWAIDDTSGTEQAYALSPDFNSFTGNSLSYVIGNTLFGRQWTVDEINNIKLALVSDGELYLDNVSLNVTYYDEFQSPSDGDGVGVAPTCEAIMDEYIQAQPFTLAKTLSPEDTYAIVKSFAMPNNVPITISMVGGKLQAVINQGNGSKEENVAIVDIIHNYNGSGLVKLDFGSIANRGLDFKSPYTAVNQNRQYHIAGSELVLSNSAPFYDRFLIKRDIGCSVSAPIEVEDEGVNIASYLRSLDFKGIPVTATATNNPSGGQDVTVTITGAGGTVPPTITHISTSTTGNSISPVLSWLHESSGVDRLLVVDVSTTQTSSITGVTYNGLPLTLHSTSLNNAGNIRLERWIMTAPTVGIYPIVVNVSPSSYISAGARSFSGVDQTTPFDGAITTLSGNGTLVVSSQTTVTQSSIALDAIATGFQPIAHNVASGQSVDFTIVNACTRQISGGSQETGSPGVFPTNYSLSASTDWALLSDGIKGITIASPTAGQNNIQFQDETINLGTSGTVDTVNFTGAGVTATRTGNTVNVTIPGGGSGTGTAVIETVTQTGHGFTVGQAVRSSYVSNQYTLAQADTGNNSAVIGIVSNVIDANTFEMTKIGEMTLTTGFPIGDSLWLSPTTAGLITNVEPTTIGQIAQPIGYVVATNAIDIKIQRGNEISNISSGGSSFITAIVGNFNIPSGLPVPINVPHGLGYTPSKMNLTWFETVGSNTTSVGLRSNGFADFSTGDNNCFYARFNNAGLGNFENLTSNTYCLYWESLGSGQTPFGLTATADSTNIIFTPNTNIGPNPVTIYYKIELFA